MQGNSPVQVIGGAPRRLRILGRPLSGLATARSPQAGLKAAHFNKPWLAALLVAPQLLILLFFFFIPSYKALSLAFVQVDPFGGLQIFVGLKNFQTLLASPEYRSSALFTLWFTLLQNIATLGLAGLFAFATDFVIRGRGIYKSIILMPYAIAPVISGVLWAFLFNPAVGPIAQFLHSLGIAWDPNRRPFDAQLLVTIASIWKNVCYDYIFLVAALLAVPASLLEAAKLDGAGPVRRFFTISLPLVSPTVFFLVVMNFVYGLFETFGIIDAVTRGGPAGATNSLVYKVYQDGFVQLDLGSSAAQSVILMIVAVLFTVLQFRALERKVNYQV
ncbi:ABC transporter permease subunit [Rhizobium mongolense]|uniref:ABC transporter permease subunit n=1 Tax=Rhizobium TaxID=379 RepID=UPI00093E3048|nr:MULTISPECIES: ABC transporter permease subunit [Rhizobium]QPB22819.1 ABC transporter permease subunit [Rhizobium sp. 007]WFU90090.1 ABC transporter permease subunit [Rhizobium sp. CC1099]